MLESYIDLSKEILGKCEAVYSPTLRLTSCSNIASSETDLSLAGIIYGSYPSQESPPELTESITSFKDLKLDLKIFTDIGPVRNITTTVGKVSVIIFISTISAEEQAAFELYNSLSSPELEFIIVNNSTVDLPEDVSHYKSIPCTEELLQGFTITKLPWISVIYQSHQIFSGSLGEFRASLLDKLLALYPVYDSLHLFALSPIENISVWDYENKKGKEISLQGTIVLDFWDENCLDMVADPLSSSNSLTYFQIYTGSQTPRKQCRYGMGVQGLSHPTILELKIVELPTTIIFSNGSVIWKGNRLFLDFSKILQAHVQGTELVFEKTSVTTQELSIITEDFKKQINENWGNSLGIKAELLFYAQFDIDTYKSYEERYRSALRAECQTLEDKKKLIEIGENLKLKLPNFKYFINCVEQGKNIADDELITKTDEVPTEKSDAKLEENKESEYKVEINEISDRVDSSNDAIMNQGILDGISQGVLDSFNAEEVKIDKPTAVKLEEKPIVDTNNVLTDLQDKEVKVDEQGVGKLKDKPRIDTNHLLEELQDKEENNYEPSADKIKAKSNLDTNNILTELQNEEEKIDDPTLGKLEENPKVEANDLFTEFQDKEVPVIKSLDQSKIEIVPDDNQGMKSSLITLEEVVPKESHEE